MTGLTLKQLLSTMYQSHPWHGVDVYVQEPELVRAFIEIVPGDPVKFELDKPTGLLKVDRPQVFSSLCPTLYGFIPQTYCERRVAKIAQRKTSREVIGGDLDPLDICVLTEKTFTHGNILVTARVIGGLRMIDKGEADDKIIAVLENDVTYGGARDLNDLPKGVVDRLCHYFLSYKRPPGATDDNLVVHIDEVYGREDAHEVIRQAMRDYTQKHGTEDERLAAMGVMFVKAAKEADAARKKAEQAKKKRKPASQPTPRRKTSATKK